MVVHRSPAYRPIAVMATPLAVIHALNHTQRDVRVSNIVAAAWDKPAQDSGRSGRPVPDHRPSKIPTGPDKMRLQRRAIVATGAAMAMPRSGRAQRPTIRIGMLNDRS